MKHFPKPRLLLGAEYLIENVMCSHYFSSLSIQKKVQDSI